MKQQIISTIKVIVLALILSAGLQYVAAQTSTSNCGDSTWTSAPANPPANNCPAPLNVGTSTPSGYQEKIGALWVNGNAVNPNAVGFYVRNGASWFNGKLKIMDGSQGAGKVLTSDATGLTTWVDPAAAVTRYPNFGGMYSPADAPYTSGRTNPLASNTMFCPSGYRAYKMYGATDVDYPIYLCLGDPTTTTPVAQWGGMWGGTTNTYYLNPYSAAGACPTGYTEAQILGLTDTDHTLKYCYKPDTTTASNFIGFFSRYNSYGNPVTGGGFGCPSINHHFSKVYGTYNEDNTIMLCTPNTVPVIVLPIVNI